MKIWKLLYKLCSFWIKCYKTYFSLSHLWQLSNRNNIEYITKLKKCLYSSFIVFELKIAVRQHNNYLYTISPTLFLYTSLLNNIALSPIASFLNRCMDIFVFKWFNNMYYLSPREKYIHNFLLQYMEQEKC